MKINTLLEKIVQLLLNLLQCIRSYCINIIMCLQQNSEYINTLRKGEADLRF